MKWVYFVSFSVHIINERLNALTIKNAEVTKAVPIIAFHQIERIQNELREQLAEKSIAAVSVISFQLLRQEE